MKSKKARARLAAEQAEAQAKLNRVETYKDHFRTMLGITPDDQAVESLVAPTSDPLRGLSWPEATQIRILPAQHDHIYQSPREWANRHRAMPVLDFSQLERRVDLQEQTVHAFSQLGRNWEQLAYRMLRSGNTVTGRATSQHVDSPPPPRPATQAEWNDLLTPGYLERLRLTETPLGTMTLESFEDMIIYGVTPTDPPEDV